MSQARTVRTITAIVAGFTFGIGLLVSGMARPSKVLGFLDVAGDWDPSLAFVMVGAIAVHAVFMRVALRPGSRPLFSERFDLPTRRSVDPPLIVGAALFGVGWGIAGYCPGPALTALTARSGETTAFVAAMGMGMLAVRFLAAMREPKSFGAARYDRPRSRVVSAE